MATATYNLNCTKGAYTSWYNQDQNNVLNTSTNYLMVGNTSGLWPYYELFLGFQAFPTSLRRKRIYSARLRAYARPGDSPISFVPCDGSFTQSSVTYRNSPNVNVSDDNFDYKPGGSIPTKSTSGDTPGTWATSWVDLTAGDAAKKSTQAAYFLKYLGLRATSISTSYNDWANAYLRGGLSDNSAMYVQISYDDATDVTSKITPASYPTTNVNPKSAQKFTWNFRRDGSYRCVNETWTQQSATLYYREQGASSWTSIAASGTTRQVSIPANTLKTTTTYEWYLSGTDNEGTSSTSSTMTFTTVDYTVTPVSYPSGNVNPWTSQKFTWKFGPNGETGYAQTSAKLYWKKSTASSWNQISVSGSTKSLTVASGTFPEGFTIQWYLQATDASGKTTTCEQKSFTTPTSAIEGISYPSGSNFDTRQAVTFTYRFASAAGDYPQSSTKLMWKKSTASSWNQITNSGTALSITAPANTFPTNATIDWKLQGTDAGGTTTTFGPFQFKTVSTTVQVTQAPASSDVYTGSAITFKWKYNSALGDYSQSSATIYWKKSTENNYHSITVSGNTQQKAVAANTFPTNATIQWYLSGTDSGGTTTQTNVATFKTLTSKITIQNSPGSGYCDPRYAITFQWYFSTAGGAVPQGSATFYWKVSTASEYTEVTISGSTAKVTIPANTFPVASTIQWYVAGEDYSGTTSQTSVFSFSTAAATAYAYCRSPIGTAVDGTKPITLSWDLVNSDGSSPMLVNLSWKQPTDVDWTTIRESSTPFSSWTVDGNFFPVGEIEWKVQATNRDSVAGPAGTAAFICLRAPDAPNGLRATAVPFTTISWQGSGQEAYEISIDGAVVQKDFGEAVNSWTVQEALEDGIHTITVRIQGGYGFWSDPAETTIDVANVPTGTLTLTGSFGTDAALTVSPEPAEDGAVRWYRDGKAIGRTVGKDHFTDRLVLGSHSWYAEIRDADGYYTRSEPVSGSLKSCVTRIAPFAGGEWIDLKLSEKSDSVQSFRYARTNALRHVLGAKLPILELAEFEDMSGSYDCAFRDVESAAAFEALRGQVVVLKSRGGNVVIGALTELAKTYTDFYISYNFSVQQIAWEDFIDEDGQNS